MGWKRWNKEMTAKAKLGGSAGLQPGEDGSHQNRLQPRPRAKAHFNYRALRHD
jgi:hypothetical protein